MKTKCIYQLIIFMCGCIYTIDTYSQTQLNINFPLTIPMSNMKDIAASSAGIGGFGLGYMFSSRHVIRFDLAYHRFGSTKYNDNLIKGSFMPLTAGYDFYILNSQFGLFTTFSGGNYIGSGDFKKSHFGFAPGLGLEYSISNLKLNLTSAYNIVYVSGGSKNYSSINFGLAYRFSSDESSSGVVADKGSESSKSTKKGLKNKELKFEKTNTSADGFLEASYNLGKRMKDLNTKLEDISLFVSVMLSNPADVIGKDVNNVVSATRQAGTIPADPNELKGKLSNFKEIKDAALSNSISVFINELKEAQESLTKVPEDVSNLLSQATSLPSQLAGELTGFGAVKIPKIVGAIGQSKTNLEVALAESKKLVINIVATLELLTEVSKKVTQ